MTRAEQTKPIRQVGRCEVFGEIGKGGMATVHLGRLVAVGGFEKIVAIKQMHKQYSADPQFVAMFLDEARLVARIKHPNVLPTLDLIEESGELFIVMDHVTGVTLRHLFWELDRRGDRMPVPVALRIMTGVLLGLHAAHEAKDSNGKALNLVHRDVSPENILVGVDGFARLLDFGMAKALGQFHMTQPGQVKGKLTCMSPEQVLGKAVSRQTDVFASGAVLWQCLTGRRLIEGEHIAEVANNVVHQEFIPPSNLAQSPKKLDAIAMRALDRDLEKRWQNAEKMALALEAVGELASHREVGVWVKKTAWNRLDENTKMVATIERAPSASVLPTRTSEPDVGGLPRAQPPGEDSVGAVAGTPPPPPPPRQADRGMAGAAKRVLRGIVGTAQGGYRRVADVDREALSRAPATVRGAIARRPKVAVTVAVVATIAALGLVVGVSTGSSPDDTPLLTRGTTDFAGPLGSSLAVVAAKAAKAAKASASPSSTKPPPLPAPEGMVMVPAGKFLMGCNSWADRACAVDEKPGKKVHLDAFAIDRTEVMVKQYAACVEAKACDAKFLTTAGTEGVRLIEIEKCNYSRDGRDDHPMNCVSHVQAEQYCKWAGSRLPTEAEWEKAAGGPEGWRYPAGDSTITCDTAVMSEHGDGCGRGTTWPVGSKPKGASPYGAEDMAGNVWEWVADWYEPLHYRSAPDENRTGPELGRLRCARGGGWRDQAGQMLRTSVRGKHPPATHAIQLGFRCARTP
ncbi:MAG: SUMF1/EgtB/PvdO family nonheme iron enzyme [Deltaproteobacteria bacterium]|nr:SUMF1/EgtB/PvdO family nonheme iron enzyme [Deltaproteobacteria bacterium]